MLAGLVEAVGAMAGRPDLRALILTGTGAVFSAGADLDEARAGLALSPDWERLSTAIAALPCLTIAALNGSVAGARWAWCWPATCGWRCRGRGCSIR